MWWLMHFQDVYLTIIAPKLIRFKLWRRRMKSCSLTSSIIPLDSFITLLQDMQGSTGQLSECTKRGFPGPTNLRELVRAYICMCQKMSYLEVPIIARRFTSTAAGLMEVLNMDYEGPFPEDEYGNTFVLTIIDTFSRVVGLSKS